MMIIRRRDLLKGAATGLFALGSDAWAAATDSSEKRLIVILLRDAKSVLLAETAFTLSHSIAFSVTALGIVRVAPAAADHFVMRDRRLAARIYDDLGVFAAGIGQAQQGRVDRASLR